MTDSPSASPLSKPMVHGWLILDKPLGLTSTQALGRARRLIGGKKVGHGGTLDPLATGILPLAFGEATKLIPQAMDGEKEYEFTVTWGQSRDTDDSEGSVIATSEMRPTPAAILAALPLFQGTISQTPPMFSAIKLGGERAYDLARKGEKPVMTPRPVVIHSFALTHCEEGLSASFKVACGKGMYVRSLARDLASSLGTYGYVSRLHRGRVGPFRQAHAISLEKLEDLAHKGLALTALLAIKAALDDIPGLNLSASEAQRLRAGQSILIRPQHGELIQAGPILASYQDLPVALVEGKAGEFRIVRGFHF